jgi:hypothetical protein
MVFDELSSDRLFGGNRQEELIRQHCAGIDARIRTALTKAEAEKIVRQTCSSFEDSCDSSLVRSALKAYVLRIFEAEWNTKP